jgi:hypothetical protein
VNLETEDYANLIGGGTTNGFHFHRQPGESKKKSNFSLHETSIDITQNVR